MDETLVADATGLALPSPVLVGFTGGTGYYADPHTISKVSVIFAATPPPPPPSSVPDPTSGGLDPQRQRGHRGWLAAAHPGDNLPGRV